MITVTNLTKVFQGKPVLDIPFLEIPKGECFGLVGNNGAGKTTLFRLLLDLAGPTNGNVLLDGQDVSASVAWKSRVGVFLDDGFLIPYLTPDELFNFVGELRGYGSEDVSQFIKRFEKFFNGEIIGKKKYIRDLSRGNSKKVGIVAALMAEPAVVILDEPFENLDPTSQLQLRDLIRIERKRCTTTFLISSHDLLHVTEVCTRIVLLENGKIINDLMGGGEALRELNGYFHGNSRIAGNVIENT